jgi:hypothetical protein
MSEREEFEKWWDRLEQAPWYDGIQTRIAWNAWQAASAPLLEELDRERMRLVACGVVAISDTPESAASARDMHADYRSAACDDVARRVDECIRQRAQVEGLETKCALLAASWKKAEDRVVELEGTVRKMADPGHEFICAKCLLRQDGPKEEPCF